MRHLPLSDVQSTNLQLLQVILVGIERDMVGTCCKFGMNSAQAECLRSMSPASLWSFVLTLGETSLFVPRCDFVALLESPPALAAALAAAHGAYSVQPATL